jgi:hypothetical protein
MRARLPIRGACSGTAGVHRTRSTDDCEVALNRALEGRWKGVGRARHPDARGTGHRQVLVQRPAGTGVERLSFCDNCRIFDPLSLL